MANGKTKKVPTRNLKRLARVIKRKAKKVARKAKK